MLLVLWAATGCRSPQCYMWEVRSPTTSVYLLGSIHVAKPDLYPLDPAIESAFNDSDAIAVEVDLNPTAEQRAALLMFKYGMYTNGRTLEDELSPGTLEALRGFLKRKGLELEAIQTLKPWLVGEMLALQEAQALGYRPELGIDKYFSDRSRGKKPILELETIESQFRLLAGLDPQAQDLLLRDTLQSLSQVDKQLERTVEAWKRGDVEAIDRLMNEEWPEHKAIEKWRKELLEDRNVRMADKIRQWLKNDQTVLVIVGSAHLAGSDSILARLSQPEYSIRQIPQASDRRSFDSKTQPGADHD